MSTLQCKTCNATIQNGARFCGRCGNYIDVDQGDTKPLSIDQHLADRSGDLSTVEDGWNWQTVEEDSPAPFSLEVTLPPLLGADIGPSPASVPVVQGSPQMGGVPSLQGTPQAPGGAIPHAPAPLQQAPAGTGATSAAPNAPSVSSKHISEQHRQRRWFRKHHQEKPRHQPSHHLHHSGPLHHSGALHAHSQTLPERTSRIARKSLKHAGYWHLKSVLMAMVGIVVIGGLSVLFLLPFLRSHAQPAATLLLNGSVVPGGSVAIQGRNFTPGGTITFTIDGHTVSAASSSSATQARSLPVSASASQASLLQVVQQVTKAQARGGSIVVKADGSFETTIQIDPNWPVGSSRVLVATEQSSGQQARLTIMIPHPAQLTSCASTTATTSIVLGPVTEGQAQPVSTGFTLCTQGSGIVQWTANWNQRQAKWLQIEQSGNIQAPLSKQGTISASASGLKAGSYNAIVTFTDQHGLKVSLQVTFLVRPAGATTCLNTSQQSLTFSATLGLASPAAQQVTLTSCGASDSWTATAHTDDGANWLGVSPTSGQLNAKAASAVSIAVASSALAQGIYTGQVTMKAGSGIAVVNVTLNVQPSPNSPSCMSIAPQSLTFSATQGQGKPAAQSVTIGNCGPAAGWSASASTTDGANWLTINPAKGNLSTNTSDNVFIAVSGAGLQIGTYTGQVTFTMGTSAHTVSVSFTIVQQQPKPCLQVSSASLPFTATQGQGDPAPQTVTLTNCGPDGSWSTSTANNSPWLAISPVSNTLSAGASQSVSVGVSLTRLRAGTYTDSIAFTITTGTGTSQATVAVSLAVHPPQPPCLQISPASLTFSATQGQRDPARQIVTLTNCGTGGSWSASTANGSSWLTINPTSSALSAGTSQSVTVSTSIANLSAGTYNDTITFTLTNSGGTAQQTVAITLTVLPAPCLSITSTTPQASSGVIYVYAGSTASVTISNCGSDTGNLSSADGASWLTDNLQQGTSIASGGTQTITISTASSAPPGGTGTVTITLTTRGGQTSVTIMIGILSPIQ